MNSDHKSHPSYGKIVLTKPSSGHGACLFGSKVKHPSFVSMEISEATFSEDGFSEFVFGTKSIVNIYMSEAQWAHMVSSFGNGNGTPITIHSRAGVGFIESPPEPTSVIDVAKKTANDVKLDLVKRLEDLKKDVEVLSGTAGTVKKKDLANLAHNFKILASWLSSNFDFLENQVKERMEVEVAKANIEIEAIVNNAVVRLGERAIGAQLASGDTEGLKKILSGEIA
jgi:hypothetical protein